MSQSDDKPFFKFHRIYEQFTHQFPKTIKRVFAHGAYPKERCYQSSWERGIHLVCPPQKNAVIHPNAPPYMEARNRAIEEIKTIERLARDSKKGRITWKKLKKYRPCPLFRPALQSVQGEKMAPFQKLSAKTQVAKSNQMAEKLQGLRTRPKYHTRSLLETAMFRFKILFGATLWGRLFFSQQSEIYAKCLAMNTMTQLGMPNGKWMG